MEEPGVSFTCFRILMSDHLEKAVDAFRDAARTPVDNVPIVYDSNTVLNGQGGLLPFPDEPDIA